MPSLRAPVSHVAQLWLLLLAAPLSDRVLIAPLFVMRRASSRRLADLPTCRVAELPLTLCTQVGRFFCISERKTTFTTELRAGTVTVSKAAAGGARGRCVALRAHVHPVRAWVVLTRPATRGRPAQPVRAQPCEPPTAMKYEDACLSDWRCPGLETRAHASCYTVFI